MTCTAIPIKALRLESRSDPAPNDHDPGELIVEVHCPCCGAELRVEYGDDAGEIGVVGVPAERPRIICLCGSTRFWRDFQRASLRETLEGRIVLSIGSASGTDDEHFGGLPRDEYDAIRRRLDELHLRKIDLADEVLVLNVGGYIGESTRHEIAYAEEHGKPVRYLELKKDEDDG